MVKPPQPGLVIQKVDCFALSLPKKAPKTEPVAPSYPPALRNLLVNTSRVRQFWWGPPNQKRSGSEKMWSNHPNRV